LHSLFCGEATVSNDIRVDLSLKSEDPATIKAMLEEAGARQVDQVSEKGLTGIEISFLAVITLTALANLVIRLLPLLQVGVVVDARGSRVRISEGGLPRGHVLVLTKDGEKSTLHEPSEVELLPLLQQLPGSTHK
jgi:hypothetical protein